MMVKVDRKMVDGFGVIEFANDAVQIAIMPCLGAKVISLVHCRTGREWMWKAPRSPQYVRLPTGAPFEHGG